MEDFRIIIDLLTGFLLVTMAIVLTPAPNLKSKLVFRVLPVLLATCLLISAAFGLGVTITFGQ